MTKLINPQIEVKIYGGYDLTFTDARMEVKISKDLTESPNEAEVRIFNLNESTQDAIREAGENDAPIEISFSAGGRAGEGVVKAYQGEIDFAKSQDTKPGVETYIQCFSQKKNHRSFFFQRSFVKGTPIDEIVLEFVKAIGLPRGNKYDLPTSGILLSESFAGSAFELLSQYCFDIGRFAYIIDGKLFITSIFNPPEPVVYSIDPVLMLHKPIPKIRHDRTAVEMKAILEANTKDPFPPKKKKKKRKTITVEAPPVSSAVDYETVEEAIKGMDFNILAQPGLNPDCIVANNSLYYRIQEVTHSVSNLSQGSWETEIESDIYVEDGDNFLSDISGITGGGDFMLL